MEAYLIARVEAYAEPSSCASVAGLIKMPAGPACAGQKIVLALTGHGLKDSESAMSGGDENPGAGGAIDADVESVRRVLGV